MKRDARGNVPSTFVDDEKRGMERLRVVPDLVFNITHTHGFSPSSVHVRSPLDVRSFAALKQPGGGRTEFID